MRGGIHIHILEDTERKWKVTEWNFPQTRRHKARKTYTCSMCGFLIHPKEKYCRIVDVDMGEFVIDRYCIPCDTALSYYIESHELTKDDFLPDASELHSFLDEGIAGRDEEDRKLLFECFTRLNKKLGWDK